MFKKLSSFAKGQNIALKETLDVEVESPVIHEHEDESISSFKNSKEDKALTIKDSVSDKPV